MLIGCGKYTSGLQLYLVLNADYGFVKKKHKNRWIEEDILLIKIVGLSWISTVISVELWLKHTCKIEHSKYEI